MNSKIIAFTAAAAIFCAPVAFADDTSTDMNSNSGVTSTDSSNSTAGPMDTSTPPVSTTGTTMSTTTTSTQPGNSIEDLATSTQAHVNIQFKTADGKIINAVVHPGDLVGVKTGDEVQLTVPSDGTMTTTTTTP